MSEIKPTPMETKITWTGSDGDYTAKVEEYDFGIYEFGDEYHWWFAKGSYVIYDDYSPTVEEAKAAAEQAYFNHVNKK